MPRGIPNTKRDDWGLKYTSLHVPLPTNPKHLGSTYLKSETQTTWFRNSMKKQQVDTSSTSTPSEQRRGYQVLVIHPGSQNLRIGRACDITPITVPTVIARKQRTEVPINPEYSQGIIRPRDPDAMDTDEDPFTNKLSVISTALRTRMKFFKVRATPNATNSASAANEAFQPESILEHNDPFQLDWLDSSTEEDYLVGDRALRVGKDTSYLKRWPIYKSTFNTKVYPSLQVILGDLEQILRTTLEDRLSITSADYRNYSVVLVIPDLWDRNYVRHWTNLLLITMGFKQLCAQQESLAATYGSGVTSACVIDIGATTTTIACVDEGLVLGDTRLSLDIGGNDITEFLYVLLERINFPYREVNLAQTYDWAVLDDLKTKMASLLEADVTSKTHDFAVRKPGVLTHKYAVRVYEEPVLAPMILFENTVIDYDAKRARIAMAPATDVVEDILEQTNMGDQITPAMLNATQHLLSHESAQVPVEPSDQGTSDGTPTQPTTLEQLPLAPVSAPAPAPAPAVSPAQAEQQKEDPSTVTTPVEPLNKPDVDIPFEAGKLPLDVAIFHSVRAVGSDERIKKYLGAIMLIGGSSLIPGIDSALSSRVQAITYNRFENIKVQVVPQPKDVDPRILAWKGAAVLGKMEGVSELWITEADWDLLGMRGLKERCFFL